MLSIGLRFIEEINNIRGEVESKIIKEINESMINYDGCSQIELKNHKDPSTNLHMDGDLEEFSRYLDSDFKPEIDLSEDITPKLFAGDKFNDSIVKCNEVSVNKVNLAYQGHKDANYKGLYSERRDILCKNLIRAIRRYLWELFIKEYDITSYSSKKASELFKQNVSEFYEKNFKQYAFNEKEVINESHEEIIFVIGILLTKKWIFPTLWNK